MCYVIKSKGSRLFFSKHFILKLKYLTVINIAPLKRSYTKLWNDRSPLEKFFKLQNKKFLTSGWFWVGTYRIWIGGSRQKNIY